MTDVRETKLNLFYTGADSSFRIFSVPSNWPYCPIKDYASSLKKTDYILFLDWNPFQGAAWQTEYIQDLPRQNLIFLSGTKEAHLIRLELGLNSHLISNNIFINYNQINCSKSPFDKSPIYKAVYTARATHFKRIGLASQVPDLALVIDRWFKSNFVKLDEAYLSINSKYLNKSRLSLSELNEIYINSGCGLALSDREGACFTVVEYLLSGIPVVSTKPIDALGLGGRELWLNGENSIYTESDPGAVKEGVEYLCGLRLDPIKLRNSCIKEIDRQRLYVANSILKPIFDIHEEICDVEHLMCGANSFLSNNDHNRHRLSAEYANCPLSQVRNLNDV
jgi:hypothetical protein